ncbi:GTP cyclohydrolase MptA protein [Halorhabdus tiamatea SARL4B]|uniref:GTP cyclohydrolase MptA n=1 Tax=Halorhabdus tiamatea SARL4B TaxID=1033806 RepID=F7PPY1_9EURY|nr:GTP cyclohydrolase MptA [Halorhabdus tiamatea]ERJ07326.1 GTP cyclohydrolase MptA protein [Halorhabdus tiamatea SARL4B]CCQ34103.1 GTP cyclohydrolase [Halorhabdus tiamatea SARL4B]
MSKQLPDVQANSPEVAVGLNRVGVTGVEKLVEIDRADRRPIVLMATFDVFVDLPTWRKGADMSRNMEVIDETLEAAVDNTGYRVEDVCGDAAERLLGKHDYTDRAEVRMEAEYVTRERTPATDRPTQSTADIIASATATEDGTREEIGARVTGMTVCPCSQGMSESRARQTLNDLDVDRETINAFLDEVPQAGHSQRGHATLTLESDGSPDVDLREVIAVARDAMSAHIYNLAKRPDEDHMTYEAHSDAKFVEDCVRSLAEGVVETFPDLPADAVVRMEQSNDESIHQHNAHAERVARFGDLQAEVTGDAEGGNPEPADGVDRRTNGSGDR